MESADLGDERGMKHEANLTEQVWFTALKNIAGPPAVRLEYDPTLAQVTYFPCHQYDNWPIL